MPDKSKPTPVRLPGDPISDIREIEVPRAQAPATEKPAPSKPAVAERPQPAIPAARKPADVTAAKPEDEKPATDAKPVTEAKAEPQDGPEANYGIVEPTTADPMAWVKYDEDVANAKAAFEKKRDEAAAQPDAAHAAAAAGAKPEGEKPVVEGELQPPPARTTAAGLPADDEFELEPGNKWKRSQIVNEITAARTAAADAGAYQELFGFRTAEDAKKNWGPLLAEIHTEGQPLVSALEQARADYYLRRDDPEYAAYMDENRQRYLDWRKENPGDVRRSGPRDAAADDSPLARQVAELREQITARDTQAQQRAAFDAFAQKIAVERQQLWTAYPVLQHEPDLWAAIRDHAVATAQAERAQRGASTYTLTDAVRDRWPLVQKFMAMRSADGGAIAIAEQPTPVPVRAGGGGTTTADQGDAPARERQFASADDAAAAWLRDHPKEFTG